MDCWNIFLSIMLTDCDQITQIKRSGNAAVFVSGVPEFARRGYIELVDARTGIPGSIPAFLVRTIKRAKHQPIWIPGPNFPDEPVDMYEQMRPSMRGNEIVWQHFPGKSASTWRERAGKHEDRQRG